MANKIICFGFTEVDLTNTDKILFPVANITKSEFIDYYARIGDIMLRYVKDRCVSLNRFPDGVDGKSFYHKDAEDYFPEWVRRFPVKRSDGKKVNYVVPENVATLVYLANLASVMHPWLSKIEHLDTPDRLIFDFDPSAKITFGAIKRAALDLKGILEDELGLKSFIMTTGSRGLHITVPIKPEQDFAVVKEFAKGVAQILVARNPKKYTLELRKEKRGDKIFIDTLRNEYGQTAVAPYAVRFIEGGPIATPIGWDELKKIKNAQHYTLKNIFRRLARYEDPWKDIDSHAQSITKAIKLVAKLGKK
ncbi:MAG: non-homologous end-joining DNA ligase [Candidatus Babeliales bacterium]